MKVLSAKPSLSQPVGFCSVDTTIEIDGQQHSGRIVSEIDGRDIELEGFTESIIENWDWDEFWSDNDNTEKVESAIEACSPAAS